MNAIANIETLTLEQAEDLDAFWLEDKGNFSRYAIGGEESAWYCNDCERFSDNNPYEGWCECHPEADEDESDE